MIANIPSHYLIIGSTVMAVFMGVFVMFVRVRSQKKPVNAKKILIPPFAMSTGGSCLFLSNFEFHRCKY